jgi:HEAT repeat protein
VDKQSDASDVAITELPRQEVQRALRLWTWEGSAATIWGTFCGGAFQTGFALYLGCSEFIIGALAAIPAFAGLLQLFSSYYAQRYGNRKQIVIWSGVLGRLLWLPMLLIPFVLPKSLWVGIFLLLTVLSSALLNIGGPLWTAWISDLVPKDYRGRYFGRRNMYAGFVGMVASILGGLFIDHATKQATMSQPLAFGALFGVAGVFALCSFFLGSRSPDVAPSVSAAGASAPGPKAALRYYSAPFRDRNFRRIMLYNAILAAATGIAGQFFTVYQIKYLHFDYTVMQLLGAVASIAGLGVMPLWGYLADKYGNKPILAICNVLVIIAPFLWLVTVPDSFPGLWTVTHGGHVIVSFSKIDICVLNLIAGASWAGVGLTQFNMMIGLAPPEQRTVYVSAVSATTGIIGGIAPLLGGAMITAMAETHFPATGMVRNSYHIVFLASALFRAVALLLLQPIREEGSNSTRYVIGQLRATKPIASFRNISRLSKGSVASRQAAAEQLATIRTPVAVEELVRALDDVSLRVREEAARALGEIGDERAVTPLVVKLTDPSSGITNAAATALGKIGSSHALPSLAAAAQLGPLSRQLAALEALGRIDDDRVSGLLISLASSNDASVRSTAIRALIEREDPSAGNAMAVILDRETDLATVTTLADALGRVGSIAALGPLLRALDRISTPIARRSAINAVGSIVGGRDSLYPYLALEPFARDEIVSRTLMSAQRRMQQRAKRGSLPGAARIAARARQAVEAYAAGDLSACLTSMRKLTDLIEVSERAEPVQRVLRWLDDRRKGGETVVENEEILLAVFLVRMVTE